MALCIGSAIATPQHAPPAFFSEIRRSIFIAYILGISFSFPVVCYLSHYLSNLLQSCANASAAFRSIP